MKIKVKNIQIREILQYGKGNLTHNTKIPVVEAKLVLPHDQPMKRGDVDSPIGGMAPILISETEKIEADDWVLDRNKQIKQATGAWWNIQHDEKIVGNNYKILALPEHFTLMQLDHLVWGNLRNGDKVYVECEKTKHTPEELEKKLKQIMYSGAKAESPYHIKSPLSIYPIEEKMYTKKEIMAMFDQVPPNTNGSKLTWLNIKLWFEQKLK